MRISRRLHFHALSSPRADLHQNTEFDHVLSLFAALAHPAHLLHHHHLGSFTTEQPGRFFFFLKGAWQKAPPQDQTVRIWDNHNPPQLISDQTLLSSPVNDSFYSSALRCTTTTPPTPLTLMETGVKVHTGSSGPCVSRSKRCPPNRTKTASYPARNGAFLTNAVFNRNFHTPFSRGFSV